MARQITTLAVNAFNNSQNFKRDNTTVTNKDGLTELRLFGHVIATKFMGKVKITNAGHSTNTTKERLNGLDGVSISQKNFIWYLNGSEWDGNWFTL